MQQPCSSSSSSIAVPIKKRRSPVIECASPFSSSIAVPIKKRRFPVIECASPLPEGSPSTSEDNEQESKIPDAKASSFEVNKHEPMIPDVKLFSEDNYQEPRLFNASADGVSTGISDPSKSSALVTPDTDVEFSQANVEISESKPQKPEPNFSLGTMAALRSATDMLSTDKSAETKVYGSSVGAHIMSTKQEIVSGQREGTCRLELRTGSQDVELALEPKEPLEPTLEHHTSKSEMSDKSDPVSLNLSMVEDKLVLRDNNDSTVKNVGGQARANRSNWDLNTSMDEWEGSSNDDSFAHSSVDTGAFIKTTNCNDAKSSVRETAAGTVSLSLSKGKHIFNEHTPNACNTSMRLPSQQCKPDATLGLSIAMPYKDLDSKWKQASVSEKLSFTNTGSTLNLQKAQVSPKDVNFSSSRAVKLEPVDESSKPDCSIDSSSSNMGMPRSSSMKTALVGNRLNGTVLLSSVSPQKLVECRPIKSELVQEGNYEVCKSESSVLPQYVGRLMQHQESTASSSAMSMPLTPQSSCPSRLSACSELTSRHSFEVHGLKTKANEPNAAMVSKPFGIDGKESRLCKVGNSKGEDSEKLKMTQGDEHPSILCGISEVSANDEEKINLLTEMLEEDTLGSDCESHDLAVGTPVDEGRNLCNKEDGEYEEGELREPLPHSVREDTVDEGKKSDSLHLIESGSKNLQPGVISGDQSTNTSDYDGKSAISENHDENHSDHIKECVIVGYEPYIEDNPLQKLSDKVSEVGVEDKRSISVTPEKRVGLSRQTDVAKDIGEEVSSDGPTNRSHGTGTLLDNNGNDNVVKRFCLEKNDSSFSVVEASTNGNDVANDSTNLGNKSRIITLPRASAVTTSGRTRSFPNRFLTSRNGKERYFDLDEDIQPRGNRTDIYADGSNKYLKDRVHDPSLRHSRPSFMLGKGRGSGRFGPSRNEWDTDHDFASEYNGPSDYRVTRHKHASSITDAELGYNGYGVGPDSPALGGSRRKAMNDDKFMRHLSDDIMDPVFSRPQTMYDEFDGQPTRGNRNISTMHRKGYQRIQSKSPVRSRTRSPGPWSSRRRRSRDELPEFNQHRSPEMYRMRRMGSPDRSCFHDEMVPRRRGSPSFGSRPSNDLRDVDCGREHVHPRSVTSNRRSSPARVFQRSARRGDVLESRERGDGIDERRKFLERREPFHSFRPSYKGESDNFHFHQNDGPRPYRFCQDADAEFVGRNNMRERDFNGGRVKHQPLVVTRRIRDMEEQQDGNYRPGGRVWHDDGFNDVSGMKRRRF